MAAEVIKGLPHLQGHLMHDAQTAVLMREHGIKRIYTRDTNSTDSGSSSQSIHLAREDQEGLITAPRRTTEGARTGPGSATILPRLRPDFCCRFAQVLPIAGRRHTLQSWQAETTPAITSA